MSFLAPTREFYFRHQPTIISQVNHTSTFKILIRDEVTFPTWFGSDCWSLTQPLDEPFEYICARIIFTLVSCRSISLVYASSAAASHHTGNTQPAVWPQQAHFKVRFSPGLAALYPKKISHFPRAPTYPQIFPASVHFHYKLNIFLPVSEKIILCLFPLGCCCSWLCCRVHRDKTCLDVTLKNRLSLHWDNCVFSVGFGVRVRWLHIIVGFDFISQDHPSFSPLFLHPCLNLPLK